MDNSIGPGYERDSPFAARMRCHQSWYRTKIIGVPLGTGPGPRSTCELESMLTRESGAKGLNFLTPEIFELVKSRLNEGRGAVEAYRLLHNMLSSQPMCFNLFGPLKTHRDLATGVFKLIIPDEVDVVVNVEFEYAPPEPASQYLNDRTAFDAFVEFVRLDGGWGFVGIETKLTEPFSQKHYDGPDYRRWAERWDSPWPPETWNALSNVRHNQLWRDHLLAVAMKLHPEKCYTSGFFMLVRHPSDNQCSETVGKYRKLLKQWDNSFLDYPMDRLVDLMESAVRGTTRESWLAEFKRRYLDLSLSEKEWQR